MSHEQDTPSRPEPARADQVSRRELTQLKWLATVVPGAAVLMYETARFEILELASMRERAAALGGELRIESAPRAGTRLVLSVPLAPHSGEGEAKDAPLASAAG